MSNKKEDSKREDNKKPLGVLSVGSSPTGGAIYKVWHKLATLICPPELPIFLFVPFTFNKV